MKKKIKWLIAFAIIFPLIITLIMKTINGKNEKLCLSGRTVIVENNGYTIKTDVEQFIPCVLAAQFQPNCEDTSIELLKAQSVVIRTYIYYKMKNAQSIDAKQLGLPFIPYCQLEEIWYRNFCSEKSDTPMGFLCNLTGLGKSKCREEQLKFWDNIIGSTKGKVLKNKGKIVLPLFHQTSNGKTRNSEKVLGEEYDYLKSVKCSKDMQQNNFIGIKYFTVKEFVNKLNENGIVIYKDKAEKFDYTKMDSKDLLNIINCKNLDETGYQLGLKIGDTQISGDLFAKALDLQSTSFEIQEYEKGIRITTKGIGHGFGMSLTYGNYLAGQGENWKEILKKFYDCSIVDN